MDLLGKILNLLYKYFIVCVMICAFITFYIVLSNINAAKNTAEQWISAKAEVTGVEKRQSLSFNGDQMNYVLIVKYPVNNQIITKEIPVATEPKIKSGATADILINPNDYKNIIEADLSGLSKLYFYLGISVFAIIVCALLLFPYGYFRKRPEKEEVQEDQTEASPESAQSPE